MLDVECVEEYSPMGRVLATVVNLVRFFLGGQRKIVPTCVVALAGCSRMEAMKLFVDKHNPVKQTPFLCHVVQAPIPLACTYLLCGP